jgi:hypothetical protein
MRTVQDTFNTVIDDGLYGIGPGQDMYMCHALNAASDVIISAAEANAAIAEIKAYLKPGASGTMHRHLARMHPDAFRKAECNDYGDRDFTFIYRDWANRPANLGVTTCESW